MKPLPLLIFAFSVLLFTCQNENYYPKNLRKLSSEEKIYRAKIGILPNPEIIVKDQNGKIISPDAIAKIKNIEDWTTDVYVNEEGVDLELVLRKATGEDLRVRKEINRINREEINIPQIAIQCNNISPILEEVLQLDQGMRNGNQPFDQSIDRQNLIKVVSIIEQCGIEQIKSLSPDDIHVIWLVIQHAPTKYQKHYFPMFEDLVASDQLKRSSLAMMEDRILMADKKPQKYGTQVTKNKATEKWELYQLENPEQVNERRLEVGFGPIERYLKRWDINFDLSKR